MAYFAAARTTTCLFNPYWPRAFLLALACLHITTEEPFRFRDPSKMTDHVRSLDMIAPDEKGPEVLQWMEQLPPAYAAVRSHPAFRRIWGDIQDLVGAGSSLHARIAIRIESALSGTLGIPAGVLPSITVIVNPLQAPQVDDYVHIHGSTYAITARQDAAPLIHEILHHVLNPLLEHERATIAEFRYLLEPVLADMIALRYAWDESLSSWHRVFEENLMRAASVFAARADDPEGARRTVERYAYDGFIYSPVILEEFYASWGGPEEFPAFLKRCLTACHRLIT